MDTRATIQEEALPEEKDTDIIKVKRSLVEKINYARNGYGLWREGEANEQRFYARNIGTGRGRNVFR